LNIDEKQWKSPIFRKAIILQKRALTPYKTIGVA